MPSRRLPRVLASALVIVMLGSSLAAPSARADRGPIVGGSMHWSPLAASDILGRASPAGLPAFSSRPFRVAAYPIRTVAWADLSMNGLSLPRLATPPNADPDGIPYKVVDGRNYYSPGNLASDGLRYVDAYVRTGNPAYLDRALVRATRLRTLGIRRDVALTFPYLFDYPNERLVAPWVSAYAQGFALSFFVRLYRVTGEWAFVEDARAIAMSFRLLGPTRRHWVAYAPNSDLWLEEYPSAKPSHVLNGFNYALFGLHEYERLTRDPVARELLQGGLATIRKFGTSYRVPGGISYYDLVHRTQHLHYHQIHIDQLRDLSALSGDPWFGQFAAQLAADRS